MSGCGVRSIPRPGDGLGGQSYAKAGDRGNPSRSSGDDHPPDVGWPRPDQGTGSLTNVRDPITVLSVVASYRQFVRFLITGCKNCESRGGMMSPAERKDLSKAEWKVMKIVWELRKAMAREVYTIAGEQYSWTPATVKTLLKRLVDKGYVSTTRVGNGFVYRPAQTALSTLQSAADTLMTNAVEGVTGPLLVHMVERMSLSEDDLDSLQKLIDAKKQSLKTRGDR
jgi:BlaI family penicillinase repressor